MLCILHTNLSESSKVPTDDCFADLLIGDSALLMYYGESRTRSRNSTIVHISQGFVDICVCVKLCMSKAFKVIVAVESKDWTIWQLFMRHWYVRDTGVWVRRVLSFCGFFVFFVFYVVVFFCVFFISIISSLFLHTLLYIFMIAFQNIYI